MLSFSATYPTLRLFLPIAGGLLVKYYGYTSLFAIGIIILVLSTFQTYKLTPKKINLHYQDSMRRSKNFKSLVLIEGMGTTIMMILVPLITFNFVTEEVKFGAFLSITSIFGVLASILSAHKSDKNQSRVEYIYPTAIIAGLATLTAAFANSFIAWTSLIGLATFAIRIRNPFYEAVVLDHGKNLPDSMHSREILLNLGRTIAVILILFLYLIFGNLKLPLIILSLVTLYYPFLLSKKQLYIQSESISKYFRNRASNITRSTIYPVFWLLPKKANDKLYYKWKYVKNKIK